MSSSAHRRAHSGSVRRLFAIYAAVSLVPILLLGAVLVALLNSQGDAEGLAAGRSKADLLARASVAPLIDDRPIDLTLPDDRRVALQQMITAAVRDGAVLRVRLRDLQGRIVVSGDAPGAGGQGAHPASGSVDEEALEALRGNTIAHLTTLNADVDHAGATGPRVVEVYEPLTGERGARLGVLEVYLPYAPISAEIVKRQRLVTAALAAGLALLWLSLSAVSLSLSRRLRRQGAVNAYLASNDTLTGLPNRVRFNQQLARALDAAGPGQLVGVALFDLDHFRDVNDTLGHRTGDDLLLRLAGRLDQHRRPGDTVARLGGDEFGVVLSGAASAQEVTELLTMLRAVIAEPAVINGLPLAVEASVGLALAPEDGADVDQLLQRADLAMYVAKRQRSGIVRYRPDLELHTSSAPALVAELGAALTRDELVLYFQPKGDLRTGTVTGLEALVRWQHPTRGLLLPDTFLPAAEQTEVIDELTRWVVRTACATLRELDRCSPLSIAVNVSARSLIRPDFAADLLGLIDSCGADPTRLVLEITETALLADPARAASALEKLHAAGLRISIDDFGVGQTSLSYLAKLPINELKIDKTFVLDMLLDDRNAAIVRSVIDLGHSLGLTVTAEGVERVDALRQLVGYGCDTVQGYLIARPASRDDLPAQLCEAGAALQAATPGLPLVVAGSAN